MTPVDEDHTHSLLGNKPNGNEGVKLKGERGKGRMGRREEREKREYVISKSIGLRTQKILHGEVVVLVPKDTEVCGMQA
jgi:hypothetical protein